MSFTLSHVIQGARKAPELLSSETAAYVILSLAEQLMGGPREVSAGSVLLHASGSLVVGDDASHCNAQASDESLRELLSALLECVSAPTISDTLRQVALGSAKGPVALRTELHAALVPLNRSAARRGLTRLHRRLSTVLADSVLSLNETSAGVSRRGRRRAAPDAEVVDDIQVTLEINEPQALANAYDTAVIDEGRAFWHPSQTTPWQFNEAAHRRGEGTPIFGSLAVQERRVASTQVQPPSIQLPAPVDSVAIGQWQPRRDEQTEAEAPVALRQQSEVRASEAAMRPVTTKSEHLDVHTRPTKAVFESSAVAVAEHDTQVDHPVASKPGLAVAHLRRVASRRSRVSDLVERFATTKSEPAERAVAELYQMASHAEGEFGAFGTATPPPVARESLLPLLPAARQKPRRIVLKASLVFAPVIAFWFVRQTTPDEMSSRPSAVAAASTECHATVRVSVPAQARVFLNDQAERAEQSGPIAVFQKVSCTGQAEVTVRVPEPSGSHLPDAWIRVPLPEADLNRAASLGRALELAPLAP